IRDYKVTGVQTCALPICGNDQWRQAWPGQLAARRSAPAARAARLLARSGAERDTVTRRRKRTGYSWKVHQGKSGRTWKSFCAKEIGRAACREREKNVGGE